MSKPVPYLFVALLNEVGVLHQSLFKLGQTVPVELLGVLGAQSLCVVQPDQEGSQDVLLLLLQPPLLLRSQTLLQRQTQDVTDKACNLKFILYLTLVNC